MASSWLFGWTLADRCCPHPERLWSGTTRRRRSPESRGGPSFVGGGWSSGTSPLGEGGKRRPSLFLPGAEKKRRGLELGGKKKGRPGISNEPAALRSPQGGTMCIKKNTAAVDKQHPMTRQANPLLTSIEIPPKKSGGGRQAGWGRRKENHLRGEHFLESAPAQNSEG